MEGTRSRGALEPAGRGGVGRKDRLGSFCRLRLSGMSECSIPAAIQCRFDVGGQGCPDQGAAWNCGKQQEAQVPALDTQDVEHPDHEIGQCDKPEKTAGQKNEKITRSDEQFRRKALMDEPTPDCDEQAGPAQDEQVKKHHRYCGCVGREASLSALSASSPGPFNWPPPSASIFRMISAVWRARGETRGVARYPDHVL